MEVTLRYIRDNNIMETSKAIGDDLKQILGVAQQVYPEVTNIRGLGSLVAFDLPE